MLTVAVVTPRAAWWTTCVPEDGLCSAGTVCSSSLCESPKTHKHFSSEINCCSVHPCGRCWGLRLGQGQITDSHQQPSADSPSLIATVKSAYLQLIMSSVPLPLPEMFVRPWSTWRPTTLSTETWRPETCWFLKTTLPKSATSVSPRKRPPSRTQPSCPSSGRPQKHSERRSHVLLSSTTVL